MGYGSGVTLDFSEAEIDRPYGLFQNYADFILVLWDSSAKKAIPLHTCYTKSMQSGWREPLIRVQRHPSQKLDAKLKTDQARAAKDVGAKAPFYIVESLTLASAMDRRTSPSDSREDYGSDSYAGILEITGVTDPDRLCGAALDTLGGVELEAEAKGWTKLRFKTLDVSDVRCVQDAMIFAGYSRPTKLTDNIELSDDEAAVEGRVMVSYTYTDADGRPRTGEEILGDFTFDALFIPSQSTRNAYAALDEPDYEDEDDDDVPAPTRRARSVRAASRKAEQAARSAMRATGEDETNCIKILDGHFANYTHTPEARAAWEKVRADLTSTTQGLPVDWASRRYATVELGPDDVPVAQSYHGGKLTDLYPDLLLPGEDGEFAVQTIDADLLALKPGEHTFTGGGAAGRWFVMREPDQYDEKTRAYATREPPIGVVIPGNATYHSEYPTRFVFAQWFVDQSTKKALSTLAAHLRPAFDLDDSYRGQTVTALIAVNKLSWKAVINALRAGPFADKANRVLVPQTGWPAESDLPASTKVKSSRWDDEPVEDDEIEDGGFDEDDFRDGVHIEQRRIRVNRGMKGSATVDGWVAYYQGKQIAQSESYKGLFKKIGEWGKTASYYPSIYQTNDHGNVTQYDYKGRMIRDWV